jgi:mannose-1-phosphate guanylyltransferase
MNVNFSNIQAVAVAGGLGKRLRPFTIEKPKALLPVGVEKKPMLEFTMMPWLKSGIKNFVFCTGYKGEMIEAYFGDGSKLGIKIEYSMEKENLETGGAIKNAIDNEKISIEKPAIVFYCDDFIRVNARDFTDFHFKGVREFGFKATAIATKRFRAQYGIMEVENLGGKIKKVVKFEEKPLIEKHANAGIYFLEPEVLKMIDEHQTPFKLEEVILPKLARKGWLMVYEISHEDWLPVNTDKEYESILRMSLADFYSKFL